MTMIYFKRTDGELRLQGKRIPLTLLWRNKLVDVSDPRSESRVGNGSALVKD